MKVPKVKGAGGGRGKNISDGAEVVSQTFGAV